MPVKYLIIVLILLNCAQLVAQETPGPQLPIVLIHADSVVGVGSPERGIREFLGNVKFVQGNVTVTCDKAVQHLGTNQAELFGKVVVTQDQMQMKAPYASYDGNSYLATMKKNVEVRQGARVVRANNMVYSTFTHIAVFTDSVRVVDDSLLMWCDTLVYNKDSRDLYGISRVLVQDTVNRIWMSGDSLTNQPSIKKLTMIGKSKLWQRDSGVLGEQLYVSADTLISRRDEQEQLEALGNAELVRGNISARSQNIFYFTSKGVLKLRDTANKQPVVWSDSVQLTADSIDVYSQDNHPRKIDGLGKAFLASRTDTIRSDRYDQVSGDTIRIYIERDTIQRLTSNGNAESITWQVADERGDGLARFTADSIVTEFIGGQPEDVVWLGGVHGERHPENIATGREQDYRLKGLNWQTNRPQATITPAPFTIPKRVRKAL